MRLRLIEWPVEGRLAGIESDRCPRLFQSAKEVVFAGHEIQSAGLCIVRENEIEECVEFFFALSHGHLSYGFSIVFFQSGIDDTGDQHARAFVRHDGYVAERQCRETFTSFRAPAAAGVIHQNIAHDPCGNREEVGTRLPLDVLLADQAQISLMNEGGGLEGVVVPLAAHVGVGEPVKLVIDEGKELLEFGMSLAKLIVGCQSAAYTGACNIVTGTRFRLL